MLNLRKPIFVAVLGTFLLNNTFLQSLPPANLVGYPVAKGATVNLIVIGFLWEKFKEEASKQCMSMISQKQDLLLELLENINNKENPKKRKSLYRKLKFLLRKECSLYKSLLSTFLETIPLEVLNLGVLGISNCGFNSDTKVTNFSYTSGPPLTKPFIKNLLIRYVIESLAGIGGSVYFLKKLDTWNIEQLTKFLVKNHKTLKEILTEDQTPQESLELLIEEHYKQAVLPKSMALTKSGISGVGFLVSKIIDNKFHDRILFQAQE